MGESETDIWLIGEDIYTPGVPGDALRNMADPAAQGASALYGPAEVLAVHKAWDAVGVPGGLSPVRVTLSGPDSRSPGQSGNWYCSVMGGLGPYTRSWFKSSTGGITDLGSGYALSTSDLNTFNIVCDVRDAANQFGTDYIHVDVNGDPGFPPLPY